MADTEQRIAYFNTLVFTIISGIISLGILIFMFFKPAAKLFPFLITVEVGIFFIIIISIFQIISAEKLKDKYKETKNFAINYTLCPDYYVERNINGTKVCSNEYIVEDDNRVKYIMKILPGDDIDKGISYTFPMVHEPNYTTDSAIDKFKNTIIDVAPDLKGNTEKCAAVYGRVPKYADYSRIPWTALTQRCDSYVN
jgi:hypothetical protein